MFSFILDVLRNRPDRSATGRRRVLASLFFAYQLYKRWGGKSEQVVYHEVLRPGEELKLSHLRITQRAFEKQSRKAVRTAKRQAVVDEKAARTVKKSAKRARRDAKAAKKAVRDA